MTGSAVWPTDHAGLAVLSVAECLELVAGGPVGRVAFARDGDIEVLPVNHSAPRADWVVIHADEVSGRRL